MADGGNVSWCVVCRMYHKRMLLRVTGYHSSKLFFPVSYFGVPGTATAKQDGQTDIGIAGQVLGWLEKCVYKGRIRRSRKAELFELALNFAHSS